MYVNIAILKETEKLEHRVAMVPEAAGKLLKLGARLHMECGAGDSANFPDSAYKDVIFDKDRTKLVANADVVLAVQPPALSVLAAMKEGSILISFIYVEKNPEVVKHLLDRKITCFAMERIPRITRAQAMDALSSQSAISGYYAVGLGATLLGRVLPKITSAAGAIGPAHILVMGLGVAGLEAVATAHRLGAVVEGYDVRPETAEQMASLGCTFVDTGIDARGKGGYARALTSEEKSKTDAVLTQHIQKSDLIITTAAIPGKPSPQLISSAQAQGMKTGSVIVDISAEGGGNCADSQAGKTIRVGPAIIAAPLNVPSLLPQDSSELYAKNLAAFTALFVKDNIITLDWSDEVLEKTVLTHEGIMRADATERPAYPSNTSKAKAA